MADEPSLDLGTADGQDTLEGVTTFLQAGGSAGTVLSASFIGLVVSPFVALADIIDAIGTFFEEPFTGAGEALASLLEGLFEAPGGLLTAGADISETALRGALGDSLAGAIAFPVTVALVMGALFMIMLYLREDETGDTLPGLPVDVPTDILGVEEEDTVDE